MIYVNEGYRVKYMLKNEICKIEERDLMKVVAIVGSLRKDSFNMQLVKTIEKRYSHLFEVEIADIGSLPFYNEDEEKSPSGEVQNLQENDC